MYANLKAQYERYKQSLEDGLTKLYDDEVISERSYVDQINKISSFEEFLDEKEERNRYWGVIKIE